MYLKKHMKKQMILSAVFGVVLFGFGFANFAMAEEIPGGDVIVRKKPGGIAIQVKTGADGTYKFTGLAPGTYDLATAGRVNIPLVHYTRPWGRGAPRNHRQG